MFEKTSSCQPQVLPIGNYLKGGDFMGIEPEPTGAPVPESVVGLRNSRFPERVGRDRFDTALELAGTGDPKRPVDWSLFSSIREMDDVTG